jgi:serine/threonine protein kinase
MFFEDGTITDKAGTLWYSAPEVLCGSHSYSHAVDMWSAGLLTLK